MTFNLRGDYSSYIAALIGMPHRKSSVNRVHWLVRTPVCWSPSIFHAQAIREYQNLSVFYADFTQLTLLIGQNHAPENA